MDTAVYTIKKFNLLSKGDKIIVGVSGGPDSMALLHYLSSIKEEYSISLYVVHINHMLRGNEADEETEYVKNYCDKNNIKCYIRYININKIAQDKKISKEEAGRIARYDYFNEIAKEVSANKVATAHNLNDQAETILMRIMRGTGLDGLCGILPIRDNFYIRPFINTSRNEIEEYCTKNNIEPRIDSTNLKALYTRNKIRLDLIPYIKNNYTKNIEYALVSMSQLLYEDNEYFNEYIDKLFKDNVRSINDSLIIDLKFLKSNHNSIKKRLIRKIINELKGNLVQIESKHIDIILSLIDNSIKGTAVELPGKIKARIRYGNLEIYKTLLHEKIDFNKSIMVPGRTYISEINSEIICNIYELKVNFNSNNMFIKYFDYDKIKNELVLRTRNNGDYIVPIGMNGRKKVKDLFIDEKVPKEERDKIPIMLCGNEIMWVIGIKVSNNFKIGDNTKRVLKIEYKQLGGKKYDE